MNAFFEEWAQCTAVQAGYEASYGCFFVQEGPPARASSYWCSSDTPGGSMSFLKELDSNIGTIVAIMVMVVGR